MKRVSLLVSFGSFLVSTTGAADSPDVPANPPPDARLKVDMLLVAAHPDDETFVKSYLARAIFDEGRKIAVVFATHGDAGTNEVGFESGASLSIIRELEARKAMATLGVDMVWFLDGGKDLAGGDVLSSLALWRHGAILEQVVRFIRLTRPEVVITLLPGYVIGENHGDHQAAGVVATEAFDLAGDPVAFPAQVATPPDRLRMFSNLQEGLRPWQAKKLYYMSDASRMSVFKEYGPSYPVGAISPSKKVPYYQLGAAQESHYDTQGRRGSKEAVATGDFSKMKPWAEKAVTQLILGKSHVGGKATDDVFEGVAPGALPFMPPRARSVKPRQGLSLEIGGPWGFYQEFWAAHGIQHVAKPVGTVAAVKAGGKQIVPLFLYNATAKSTEVTLTATLPEGWIAAVGPGRYQVAAHDMYRIQAMVQASSEKSASESGMAWKAEAAGKAIGSVTMQVKAR